ncbi:MAG: hypothetical protein R3C01_04290 [Planctomycetaceae bacterium]
MTSTIPTCRVAVVEPTAWYAPEIQRQLGPDVVVESHEWIDLLANPSTASLVVIVLKSHYEQGVRAVAELKQTTPQVSVLVILPKSIATLEWTLWECGADGVTSEFLSGRELATMCRRLMIPRTGES